MNKLCLSALMATMICAGTAEAVAHDYDDGYHEHHHRYWGERYGVQPVYGPPVVAYVSPPAYYPPPAPVYYQPVPPDYSARLVGQTVGAVAGGLIGNSLGHGRERFASTALGAVIGSVVGGSLAR